MTARDESGALAVNTAQLVAQLEEIHFLRARLWSALIEFAEQWFDTKWGQVISSEPGILLTPDQIGGLKLEVTALRLTANQAVRDEIDGADLWWPEELDEQGSQFSAALMVKLRLVLGKLATPLEPFGYLREAVENIPHWRHTWRMHSPGFQTPSNAPPYYPDDLLYSQGLDDAVERYKCRLVAAHKLCRMTSNLRDRLREPCN